MATFFGVIAIILWGALALLGINTLDIPPFQLLFCCFLISSLLMFIKRFVEKQPLLTPPSLTITQWLVGIAGLFGFHFSYFMALKHAPAIEVSLISYTWPIILAILVATKQSRLRALVGGLIGFVGICFIIIGDLTLSLDLAYLKGYILAACCAFLWSSYSWFLSKTHNHVDDIGWLSLIVATLSFSAHIVLEPSHWQFTSNQWIGIVLLGLGPVGGAFYLWDIALKKGNRTLLASLSFSAPVISAILLSITGYNTWSFNVLIALTLIVFGVVIANDLKAIMKYLTSSSISFIRNKS